MKSAVPREIIDTRGGFEKDHWCTRWLRLLAGDTPRHSRDLQLRVKRNKVGVISQADKLDAESLKLALTRVTTSPWILDNVTKMQKVFYAEETTVPRPSVELVEGVINGTLPS